MEASSAVVIKVKYGDMLRRFNARIVDGGLDLSIDGLREKICLLFCFSPETELLLTYIDEDGDVVTLVDDEDLRDVVKQALNPLRIIVRLNAEKNDKQVNNSSGSYTPMRSPRVQQPLQKPKSDLAEILRNVLVPLHDSHMKFSTGLASNPLSCAPDKEKQSHNLNSGLSQIIRTVQEPVFETLVKLSTDLVSKSSTSAPGVANLVDYFSKVSFSYLDQLSGSLPNVKRSTQSGVPENITVAAATSKIPTNDGTEVQSVESKQSLTKFELEATTENNEVKSGNLKTNSKGPGFDAIPSAVDFKTKSVSKKEKVKNINECQSNENCHSTTSHPPPVANNGLFVGKFGEFCCTPVNLPSVANNIPTGKEFIKPNEPYAESNIANNGAPDFVKEESLDGRTQYAFPNNIWSFRHSVSSPSNNTWNYPEPLSGPSSMYECPYSGLQVVDVPAASSRPASQDFPSRRSSSQNEGSGIISHWGVCCDGCGVHPITGPRFKSKVKVDYDLCGICFSQTRNDADYIRMDSSVISRPHMSFKWFLDTVCKGYKVKSGASMLDSRFIQDVNIMDGTIMAPLTPFTKIWRMRNNGTALWPHKTQLVWIGGDKLSNDVVLEIEIPEGGLPVNQELDIAVNFIAPELPGQYISYWRMVSPSGQKFGQRVWALIQVDASLMETQHERLWGFNLNLPPVGSFPENNVEDGQTRLDDSEKTVELVKPVVNLKPNIEHEMKFPINDNLLVGSETSSSDTSAASPVYLMIDLNDGEAFCSSIAPSSPVLDLPPRSPAPATNSRVSAADLSEMKEVEEELLMKLGHMGFKNVDLNKEILRINEYNLEQAVDDLCAAGEWDHILDELWDMGFEDLETNKMLLKKSNGSIKRAVMELIARENFPM